MVEVDDVAGSGEVEDEAGAGLDVEVDDCREVEVEPLDPPEQAATTSSVANATPTNSGGRA